jgi:putative ABC transport system substrate-binding protein
MGKFLLIIALLVSFLLTGCSDKGNNIKTVAFVSLSSVDDNTFNGFKLKMEKFGWIENENIRYIVSGPAQNVKSLPGKVKKVIDKKPDMIFVSSTPAAQEVKKQNTGIPVVFCPVNDPVGAGILQNTNAPEGFITGVRLPSGDFKRTEWLYQIVPHIKKVLVPFTKNDLCSLRSISDIETIARELGFTIIKKPLDERKNIKEFLKDIPENIDAIILPRDSIVESKIESFVDYSLQKKLPLSVPSYQQVQKGGLYTYGFIHSELGKDAAIIANKVLKGIKVKDIPVKFGSAYLVLNKKTADKIGLSFTKDTLDNAKLIIKY